MDRFFSLKTSEVKKIKMQYSKAKSSRTYCKVVVGLVKKQQPETVFGRGRRFYAEKVQLWIYFTQICTSVLQKIPKKVKRMAVDVLMYVIQGIALLLSLSVFASLSTFCCVSGEYSTKQDFLVELYGVIWMD